jgi:hypothetical protein
MVGLSILSLVKRQETKTALAASSRTQPLFSRDHEEERRACPFCAELIKSEAKVCRYCRANLVPPSEKIEMPIIDTPGQDNPQGSIGGEVVQQQEILPTIVHRNRDRRNPGRSHSRNLLLQTCFRLFNLLDGSQCVVRGDHVCGWIGRSSCWRGKQAHCSFSDSLGDRFFCHILLYHRCSDGPPE